MHGSYLISILFAIVSLSLTCLQPIFWSSKEAIFMLSKTHRGSQLAAVKWRLHKLVMTVNRAYFYEWVNGRFKTFK